MKLISTVKYIIDSGPIIDLKHYYDDVFISLWKNMESYFSSEIIISSSEAYRELNKRDDDARKLADKFKYIFKKPEIEEMEYVKEILAKHKELIKTRNLSVGLPVADPFIIAQAICNEAILITNEIFKPNAHNIPNICFEYNVEYMNLKQFFIHEKWKF